MYIILWKIKEIIDKCNLIPVTVENIDWLIPNNIKSTLTALNNIDELGATKKPTHVVLPKGLWGLRSISKNPSKIV